MDLLAGTFDSTNALSGIFLWLIFGYLAGLLNCDLQRFLARNPLWVHAFGLLAFLFLFTLLDGNNTAGVPTIALKTLFVYVLFVLMTKSKWYFVLPVLALLLLDQLVKKDTAFRSARGELTAEQEARRRQLANALNAATLALIVTGALQYAYLQYIEYGARFSTYAFLFGVTRCKPQAPRYSRS